MSLSPPLGIQFMKARRWAIAAVAAFALAPGESTKAPVKTQFGWHVIYLEDRRAAPAPSLSEVEAQLRNEMTREIEVDYVKALTAEATVERFNMDGTPMKELVQ